MRRSTFALACLAFSGQAGTVHNADENLQGAAPNRQKELAILLLGFNCHLGTWSVPGFGQGRISPLIYGRSSELSMQDVEPPCDQDQLGSSLDEAGRRGSEDEGPVLRFREARTGVPVVLVGTMHFNPASIGLTEDIVRQEGMADAGVGSVVVELCPSRWNETAARLRAEPAQGFTIRSFRRWLFRDEFQAAFEMAERCEINNFELADQDYQETMGRLRYLFRLTAKQVLSGPRGWIEIGRDARRGIDELFSIRGVDGFSFFDPSLLAGLPVTLVRQVAAIPGPATAFGCALFALDKGLDYFVPENPDTLIEEACQIAVVLSIAGLLARVLLVGLLFERNSVLACNIRSACERTSKKSKATVVAVLGMAHLNGVSKMLRSGSDDPQT